MDFHNVSQTEGGFESHPSEPNCVQRSFVGEGKPTQGGKLFAREVAPVVLENEFAIRDPGDCVRCACVVGIL